MNRFDDEQVMAQLAATQAALAEQQHQLQAERRDRQQAIAHLEELNAIYAGILANLTEAVLLTDDTGQLTFVSPNVETVLGVSAAQVRAAGSISALLGQNPFDLEALQQLGTLPPIAAQIQLELGNQRVVSIAVKRVQMGRSTRLYTCRDISHQPPDQGPLAADQPAQPIAENIAQLGSWELDLRTHQLSWSEDIFTIFEIDSQQFGASYEAFLQIVHPADRDLVNRAYTDHLRDRKPYSIVHRLLMSDGRVKYVREQCATTFDAEGNPLLSRGTVQDITPLQEAQIALEAQKLELEQRVQERTAALQTSEERWQLALKGNNDGIWDWDIVSDRIFYSQRWKEILGFQGEEFPHQRIEWILRLHPDDLDTMMNAMDQHLTGETQYYQVEYRLRNKAEQYVWILDRGQAVFDSFGRPVRMVGSHTDISERKQAEEALRTSQAKFQRLVDDIGDDFVIFSHIGSTGVLSYVSGGFEAVFGFSKEQIIDQPWAEAIPWFPEDIEAGGALIAQAIANPAESHKIEMQFSHPDGQPRTVMITLHSTWSETGALVAIEGILENITERRQAEEKLRRSEANLAAAQRVAHVGNWEYDARTQTSTWSAETFRIFGLDPQQPEPDLETLAALIHPDDRARWREVLTRSLTEQSPYQGEFRIVRPKGEVRHVESRGELVLNRRGQVVRLFGVVLDITERKQQEEALTLIVEGTAAQTGTAFFQACVRYLAKVLNGRYAIVSEFANPQKTRVRSLAYWGGTRWLDNIEYDVAQTPCETVLIGETCYYPNQAQHHFPHDDELIKLGVVSYCGVPLTDAAGQILGHLAVLDTEPMEVSPRQTQILQIFAARAGAELARLHSQEELAQANVELNQAKKAAESANQAKSEFLANMSHELRTPLNAILGFSQLMAHDASLSSTQKNNLAIINRSGEHLLELINDVLDMSKIEAGRSTLTVSTFDLHQLFADLADMFELRAHEKGLTLVTAIAPDVPTHIEADASKLRQILVNLLNNAIKFTDSGTITLRSQRLPSPASDDTPPAAPLTLWFEVEDTGYGIAAADMTKIFDAFVQSEVGLNTRAGTGLGLPITQKFVELMGGEITVVSRDMTYTAGQVAPQPLTEATEMWGGSRFRFTIQAAPGSELPPPSAPPQRRAIALAPDEVPRRILIVEDLWESRHLLEQILIPIGFEVRTAKNGQEAIALWQQWQPELIWMDMRMPVMDGYQATRYIRSQPQGATTTIIALTASSLDKERAMIIATGCDDYVRKPFREHVILEKMAEYIGVRYTYSQIEDPEEPAPPISLEAAAIALQQYLPDLPLEQVQQLWRAAKVADNDLLADFISAQHLGNPQLAQTIQHMVDNFRYDLLIQATHEFLEGRP